jgi:hypothetical protein
MNVDTRSRSVNGRYKTLMQMDQMPVLGHQVSSQQHSPTLNHAARSSSTPFPANLIVSLDDPLD